MLGKQPTPAGDEYVNELFEKFKIRETTVNRYYATSSYEFGMLLHRNLMADVHSEREAYQVERALFKINSFPTLIYKDVVWNENLGLVTNGYRVATPIEVFKDYGTIMAQLSMRFETLDGTEVLGVGARDLAIQLKSLVECESYGDSHKDATSKALSKFIDNTPNFKIDIIKSGSNVEVTYKG